MSMRRRLVMVAAATTTMVVIAFLLPLGLLVRTLAAERVLSSAREVPGALAPLLIAGDQELLEVGVAVADSRSPGTVGVVTADGETFGQPIPADVFERARAGEALEEDRGNSRVVAAPVVGVGNRTSVVAVEISHERMRAGVTESWLVLGTLGAVMIVGAVVVADRLARQIVRPVRAVATAAQRVSHGEHDARAPLDGPSEIVAMATALNALADRIQDMLAAEREAAADVSHRLRTPLTALRLDVEALGTHPDLARLQADVAAMERAIDQQIRAIRSGTRPATTADITAIVRDRADFWAPLAEDEDRAMQLSLPDHPVRVRADAEDIASALDAVIGNVFAHTPPGTGFSIGIVDDGDLVDLVVTDRGQGFPAGADLTQRGVSHGGSTGLGLDICRRLAESCGGRLELSSQDGACVRLRLPVAPSV